MTRFNCLLLLLLSVAGFSCTQYLEAKPDKHLVTPSSINDLQALLDESTRMNLSCPTLGEVSATDYYLTTENWRSLPPADQHAYTWDTANVTGVPNDWSNAYDPVYYCNIALENIHGLARTAQNKGAWDNVKGAALLYRAKSFLQSAWIWAKAYDVATASADLGIPLRLSSDFNQPSARATVQQTYDQVLEDLQAAVPLLPVTVTKTMRPSRAAAYGYLARTYWSMRLYDKALLYADSCLQLNNRLIDYNTLDTTSQYPLPAFNNEVVMLSLLARIRTNLGISIAFIDSALYQSYAANDLRKPLFFIANPDGSYGFKGGYNQSDDLFNGIATDEMYLVRAECAARAGNTGAALADLNTLLQKRLKTGSFVPVQATTPAAALEQVLQERRKELVFRDLRWIDIKRLNKEGAGIILQRTVDGRLYQLLPNANGFALPLPADMVSLTGMLQNPR